MKVELRANLTALSASKNKLERTHSSSLLANLKALEQEETNSPKRNRLQEIIKFRAEINQIEETKGTIQQNQELVLYENQQDR
jgi:hypothetical protein